MIAPRPASASASSYSMGADTSRNLHYRYRTFAEHFAKIIRVRNLSDISCFRVQALSSDRCSKPSSCFVGLSWRLHPDSVQTVALHEWGHRQAVVGLGDACPGPMAQPERLEQSIRRYYAVLNWLWSTALKQTSTHGRA